MVVEVSTTGEPAAIALSVDHDTIASDRRDVAHVTVRIVDAEGRMVPTAADEVTFEVQGEGRLIGVDSGNQLSHEDYKANCRKAYNGMCLAIVQSTAKAGPIRVTASSPGLKAATATIQTTA
jgi:beta-galactosidase